MAGKVQGIALETGGGAMCSGNKALLLAGVFQIRNPAARCRQSREERLFSYPIRNPIKNPGDKLYALSIRSVQGPIRIITNHLCMIFCNKRFLKFEARISPPLFHQCILSAF